MGKESPWPPAAQAVCDGGDLDCGSGLLLIIRSALAPLRSGEILEVLSRDSSVREDLPAWCGMVGHAFLGTQGGAGRETRYFLRKKGEDFDLERHTEEARLHRWTVRIRGNSGPGSSAFVRNHTLAIGQPASFDTADAAPSAVEMLLAALGGCLAAGFRWRASRRGIEVRNLEVSLSARADNILVFLGVQEAGSPGLAAVEGKAWVDADGDDEVLEALWRETLARSPVAQTLVRQVPVEVALARA